MTSKEFILNSGNKLYLIRGYVLDPSILLEAVHHAHETLGKLRDFEVDIFSILGMRNLSSFIGEIFIASIVKQTKGLFRKNPHQDGYPDLLLMDEHGNVAWNKCEGQLRYKSPFSPFVTGGIEVKATCGSLPTPKVFAKRGLDKPDIGDQRISFVTGYDWKAHHRETNNLLGIYWDFIDRRPFICGVFYSSKLTEEDWGKIVQPTEGGGRTTSVSIMSRKGIRTMYEGWVFVIKDQRYIDFFNSYNKGDLIPSN